MLLVVLEVIFWLGYLSTCMCHVAAYANEVYGGDGSSGQNCWIISKIAVFQPKSNVELRRAISACTELSKDCSSGPKGPINSWDVSSVADMSQIFPGMSFNGDISKWNVAAVTKMNHMFVHEYAFNSDISNWDVSNVTDMTRLFINAKSFNSDISNWDVSSVTSMYGMFDGATAFTRTLCGAWKVSTAQGKDGMFSGSSGKLCSSALRVDTQNPSLNDAIIIISGRTRVSECDPVTLNAFQSTTTVSLFNLSYQWYHWTSNTIKPTQVWNVSVPLLRLGTLSTGTHVFDLSVSYEQISVDAREKFTVIVKKDAMPLVSMACPEGVCKHINNGEFEQYIMNVNLHKQTMLPLQVDLASESCESGVKEADRLQINWKQKLDHTTEWQPQQVRLILFSL